ncbi:GNAT family N-acetyltransferase [Planctomicrobium sp. SH668]|uniref:GNAT family N-acetyltransferase n=1 Tax=Planctomicrobium sp. SH668 TaxID=3448126 RepID=UPI003F5C0F66
MSDRLDIQDSGIHESPFRAKGANDWKVRVRSLGEVNPSFLRQWKDLEQVASSPNPFLSSGFVMAAAAQLRTVADPLILTVEHNRELQFLGVFENRFASRRMPLRHLRSWKTPHTYLDAPLFRQGMEEHAVERFWDFLIHGRHEWHAVDFPKFPNQESISRIFDETSIELSVGCVKGTCWSRASMNFSESSQADVQSHLSLKRIKSLRRSRRELEKFGDVRYEIVRDFDRIDTCASELVRLESMGWKMSHGTAIAASSAEQQFFLSMISNLNQNQNVFFTRLLVDERAVISVAHLVSGDSAYAFKLGWDPAMERGAPGFLIKYLTAMEATESLPEIQMIDSCSMPGSFIERVWPHRRSFCSRTYLTSPVASVTASMLTGLRWMKNRMGAVSWSLFHPRENQDQE